MWSQNRPNRLIGERERVKEHIMHIQRLRSIKPSVDMKPPPKPTHIKNNYKKEMKNMERLSEIQYQNRVLLRKMLHIDLQNNTKHTMKRTQSTFSKREPNPQGLNSYTSLNRANRIRGLAKIIDENKNLLEKLQNTKSCYDRNKWENEFVKKEMIKNQIRTNGDRYCKNPYFLHSVCTKQGPN